MAPARGAAVALVLLASAGRVQADPPAIEIRGETRRFVRLETTGTDGIDAELEATLGELLGRLHLELVRAGAARTARSSPGYASNRATGARF
jgi:hypothetical protein